MVFYFIPFPLECTHQISRYWEEENISISKLSIYPIEFVKLFVYGLVINVITYTVYRYISLERRKTVQYSRGKRVEKHLFVR